MFKHSVHTSRLSLVLARLFQSFLSVLMMFCSYSTQAALLEEVVVTAEFRPLATAEVPGSVSVLDPQATGATINHLDELLSQAANVNLTSGASRARFIQIRGIGERSQFVEPLNASVGLLVDGVDLSGIGGAATLFDIAQVEVLRGPQGTLYGANALAGLINVVTPDATESLSGLLQLDGGNYGARGVGGVVSGPLNDSMRFRLSARQYQDDGFYNNVYLNRDDTNARDERTLRGKIQGDLETDGSWQLAAGRIDVDNGYDAFSLDNDRNTRSDEPGQDVQETTYVAFNASRTVSDGVLGQVAIGWVDSDIAYGYDEDWAYEGFPPLWGSATDLYLRDVASRTIDFRLLSAPDGGLVDGRLDWVLGLYAMNKKAGLTRDYSWNIGLFESDYSTERVAVYGELATNVGEKWRLTLGLRAEQHEADYSDSENVDFSPDDDLVGGRILLERAVGEGNLLYGSVTRGYKVGGFNTDGTLELERRLFDPEVLWNMEAGYKGVLIDDRLTLSITLFQMRRHDIQISTAFLREGSSEFVQFTGNGAKGVNQGVELEAGFQATERLQLSLGFGFLDAEFEDYINGEGEDLDGREQAQAPSYQLYMAVDYQLSELLSAHLSFESKDEYYFSDSHAEKSPSYGLINGSLKYTIRDWDLSIWGRNLSNKDYFVRGFSFPNDARNPSATRWTQLGSPRQYGVSATASF